MSWEPKSLNVRHHEIIRRKFLGQTNVDIARDLGTTAQIVMLVLGSPLAQAELERLRSRAEDLIVDVPARVQLQRDLSDAATQAVRVNKDLMLDAEVNPSVRARIAQHFQDRVIFDKDDAQERGTSYRDILRRLDSLSVNVNVNVNADASANATNDVDGFLAADCTLPSATDAPEPSLGEPSTLPMACPA